MVVYFDQLLYDCTHHATCCHYNIIIDNLLIMLHNTL